MVVVALESAALSRKEIQAQLTKLLRAQGAVTLKGRSTDSSGGMTLPVSGKKDSQEKIDVQILV